MRLCRKRYADDRVRDCLVSGIRQFAFLGAGLGTRPYRLIIPAGARAFEVALTASIDYKRERLKVLFGAVPKNAELIALDFERGALRAALQASGFRPSVRTTSAA
jgi:methyltransferase (TIGR00027 family)